MGWTREVVESRSVLPSSFPSCNYAIRNFSAYGYSATSCIPNMLPVVEVCSGMKCYQKLIILVSGICIGFNFYHAFVVDKNYFCEKEPSSQIDKPQHQKCLHGSHSSCPIRKDEPCILQEYFHTTSYISGQISSVNASRLSHDQLTTFCRGYLTASYDNIDSNIDGICRRPVENSILRFPTVNDHPYVLLPGWGFHWPGKGQHDLMEWSWQNYSTGILANDMVCFWPLVPKLSEKAHDISFWTQEKESTHIHVDHPPVHYTNAMISGGFFDNIWHASVILNKWCMMRDVEDLYFIVQSWSGNISSHVYKWGSLLGISRERIVPQDDQPIIVEDMLFAASFSVDWACLHRVLGLPLDPEADMFILLYSRNTGDLNRDIPIDISEDLENELAKQFTYLKVKKFDGTEPLEALQRLFANAALVIGPHGAGMVNVVFCQERTPVVEFTTHALLNRPWQMYGGHSFLLTWWPILLDSFDSRNQILGAVAVVKEALEQAHNRKFLK